MHWLWNSQSFHTHTHLNIYAYICKYISRANANLKSEIPSAFPFSFSQPPLSPLPFSGFHPHPPPACATPVHFLSIFWHLNVLRCRFSRFLFVHFICWLPLPVFPCPPPYTPGFSALSPPTILPPSPNPPLTLQSSLQPPPSGCLLFAPLQRVLIAFVLQHTGETTAKAMAMPNGDGNGKFKAFYNNWNPPPFWLLRPWLRPKSLLYFSWAWFFCCCAFRDRLGCWPRSAFC